MRRASHRAWRRQASRVGVDPPRDGQGERSAARAERNRSVVRVRVAGLTLALRAPGGARLPPLPEPLGAFGVSRGADIALELLEAPAPEPDASRLLFESGGVWRVHGWQGGLLYSFRADRLDPAVYKAVAVDRGITRGRLYFPRQRRGRPPGHPLAYPLDERL